MCRYISCDENVSVVIQLLVSFRRLSLISKENVHNVR